jgi:excisionase family DNA binding protein
MSTVDVRRRLVTIDEVAERLRVTRRTVERKIRRGELPALQLGDPRIALRVMERKLEEWLYSSDGKRHVRPHERGG